MEPSTKTHPNWVVKEKDARQGRKKPSVQLLSDIEREDVHWLWYPYVPSGKLVMLEGDPGLGKSWITCKIAADLSAGRPLPGQKEGLPPQKILMLSAEDGLGDTVRPRMEALGANLENVMVSDDYFILDEMGLRDMEEMIRAAGATIVFLDPIVAYMGGKIDMNKANEVRSLMGPLSEMAKRTGTPIIAVRHLRKGGSSNAKYAGIGSIDFTAAVRSVLQVSETQGGDTIMSHIKHNLSPRGDTLSYEITDGKFNWTGTYSQPADTGPSTTRASAKAEQFLHDTLKDGPVLSVVLLEKAAQAGIATVTLNRAKRGLAHSEKLQQGWVWTLDAREGMGSQVQHG